MGWFNHQPVITPFGGVTERPAGATKRFASKDLRLNGNQKKFANDGAEMGIGRWFRNGTPPKFIIRYPKNDGVFVCFVLECISFQIYDFGYLF